ncbi:MAG: DUF4851 domain-containing protein [Desulfovibrio sp.]|nr:DUF4851 domain-containing protein [Desulfovibrio sp.]
MKVLAIACFLVIGALFFVYVCKENPRQGMSALEDGQMCLVSRARPAFYCIPDSNFSLVNAGWKSVRPTDRRLDSEGVRLSLAVYQEKTEKKGLLVTAIAETPGEWEWVAAHHVPFHTLRTAEAPYGMEKIYESLFILDSKQNPFAVGEAEGKFLVYRGKFLLCFRKSQLLIEYHEPISEEEARIIDLNPDFQRAFVERGRHACTVRFIRKGENISYVENPEKFEPLGDAYSRERLGTWLGELKHPGGNR